MSFVTKAPVKPDTQMPLGLRAQSKAANRQKILDSARVLFGRLGFEGATLRDIAAEAGLSTGAVFANFSDKREVFKLILQEEKARILKTLDESYDENRALPERLLYLFAAAFKIWGENLTLFKSAMSLRWTETSDDPFIGPEFENQILALVTGYLKRAQERQELAEDFDIQTAAAILLDICVMSLRRISAKEISYDLLINSLSRKFELLVKGLGKRE